MLGGGGHCGERGEGESIEDKMYFWASTHNIWVVYQKITQMILYLSDILESISRSFRMTNKLFQFLFFFEQPLIGIKREKKTIFTMLKRIKNALR